MISRTPMWNALARQRGFKTRQRNGFTKDRACRISTCDRSASARELCDTHYRRLLRYGSPDGHAEKRLLDCKRYLQRKFRGHPLANCRTGRASVHRVVLFDCSGGGPLPCFWCGRPLRWITTRPQPVDALMVDHLDHDRHNNDETNLVPACNACNGARNRRRKKAPLISQYRRAA